MTIILVSDVVGTIQMKVEYIFFS